MDPKNIPKESVIRNLIAERRELAQSEYDHRQLETEPGTLEHSLGLLQKIIGLSAEQIIQIGLEEAVSITQSEIGYFHLVNEAQQTIALTAWSKATFENCSISEGTSHYPVANAGIWADCIRQRKPLIHNNYPRQPNRRGLPKGHPTLIRHLSIPVFDHDEVVAILGVGNKPYDYTNHDLKQLSILADQIWNITQRKHSETALILELERIAILSSFMQNAGHEFRTPLSIIRTSLYLMRNTANPIYQEKQRSKIEEQVNAIGQLVDSLVTLTKLDSGTAYPCEVFDFEYLLETLVSDFRPICAEQAIEIQILMDSLSTPFWGNRDDLEIAIMHLLKNAIAAMPTGGVLRIRATNSTAGEVVLVIEDNGIGMSETTQQHAFERFYRQDQAHSTRGFGLGLPIVKRVVELHGGSLLCESQIGKGTKITITL